ncbi:MAG TPA: hypothetical protein VGR71_11765 [Nitrospira sp.]|nr:hypothetical protein [Nitrospira sp.]
MADDDRSLAGWARIIGQMRTTPVRPGPDFRTLEQRLIERLFPQDPPKTFAEAYGATAGDRIALSRLSSDVRNQLMRLCDTNPVGAADLIQLAVDIYNEGYDEGRDDGFAEGYSGS